MFRFGFMTLIVWLTSKITKHDRINIYWVGILVTSTTFSLAHLPALFLALGKSINRLNDVLPHRYVCRWSNIWLVVLENRVRKRVFLHTSCLMSSSYWENVYRSGTNVV